MRHLYNIINEPWIYGPLWLRARRIHAHRAKTQAAQHISWARQINRKEWMA